MGAISEIDSRRLDRLDRVNERVISQERAGRHDYAKSVLIVHRWIRRYYLISLTEPQPELKELEHEYRTAPTGMDSVVAVAGPRNRAA